MIFLQEIIIFIQTPNLYSLIYPELEKIILIKIRLGGEVLGVMGAIPLKNMDIVEEIVKYRLKTEMQMFIFPTLYISTTHSVHINQQ